MRHCRVFAVVLAVLYSYAAFPDAEINGEPSFIASLLLALFVQIPVCAVLFYHVLKGFLHAPKKVITKRFGKYPENYWGMRMFEVTPDTVTMVSNHSKINMKPDKIKKVRETESSIVLCDDSIALFMLPKENFSKDEIVAALSQANSIGEASGGMI